jgi:hypothetical protein
MGGMKTFVIRLFVPAGPGLPSGVLHGVVEEIAAGRSAPFGGGEELLAFLEQRVTEPDADRLEQPIGVPDRRTR